MNVKAWIPPLPLPFLLTFRLRRRRSTPAAQPHPVTRDGQPTIAYLVDAGPLAEVEPVAPVPPVDEPDELELLPAPVSDQAVVRFAALADPFPPPPQWQQMSPPPSFGAWRPPALEPIAADELEDPQAGEGIA